MVRELELDVGVEFNKSLGFDKDSEVTILVEVLGKYPSFWTTNHELTN